MTSLALSLLIAANVVIPGSKPAAPAPAAPSATPKAAVVPGTPTSEVDNLVKAAALLEKSDGCEAAYARYQEAGGKLMTMKDRARSNQLAGIVTNKLDKLQACYSSCQPNEKQ